MKYYLPEKIYCLKYDGETNNLLKKAPLQVNLSPEGCTSFKKGDALVLDFGKENCGGLRVLTCTVMKSGKFAEGRIHITFGESYMEALSRVGEKGAGNDHAIRDFTAELTSYSDMTFGDTGYRYVRVEFIDDAEYLIKRFFGGCEIKRRKQIYKYKGKDPLISKIFSVAKRTIDLCSSRGYVWDGIKRDRLIWAGDIYPEMLALVTLYGRCAEVENSLDYVLAETSEGEWVNTVPAYSAWWVITVADYAAMTGNKDYLIKHMPDIKRIIRQIDRYVDEEGQMHFDYYFVDWPTHGKPDEYAGVRAVNIMAAKRAVSAAEELKEEFPEARALLGKLLKKEMRAESAKQIIALKYFAAGELREEEKRALIKGGDEGMSTFMSYFILTAVSALFGKNQAEKLMKDYYGKMLSCGATTFWEDFDTAWLREGSTVEHCTREEDDIHGSNGKFCYKGYRHSLCHGWSTGVIRFIYEHSEQDGENAIQT